MYTYCHMCVKYMYYADKVIRMDIEGLCFILGMGSVLIVLPVLAAVRDLLQRWKNTR